MNDQNLNLKKDRRKSEISKPRPLEMRRYGSGSADRHARE